MIMKVTAIIEKNKNEFYAVYVNDALPGFGLNGMGASVEGAKADMILAFSEYKEMCLVENKPIPELEFEYKYDLASFFNYFNWINVSKLAERAGINDSLLRQYKNGLAFASEKQALKLQNCLHQLGNELSTARF
jgi:predicted RNase H-like HicB family nuclease